MSTISKKDAENMFREAKTVEELKTLIKKQCHLWFDEDVCLKALDRAAKDKPCFFNTVLLSPEGPITLVFTIKVDGSVSIVE